jgi:hypothetical protein
VIIKDSIISKLLRKKHLKMPLIFVVRSMAVPKWKQTWPKGLRKIIVKTKNDKDKRMNKKWSEIVL